MRACLIFVCLLAATFAVKGKHRNLRETSHEKDTIIEEIKQAQILPTLVTDEVSSQELEDEEVSYQERVTVGTPFEKKISAVLMNEEELETLVKIDDTEEPEDSEITQAEVLVKDDEDAVEDAEDQVKEIVEKTEVETKHEELFEEPDGSTESEIPVDLDYASDSGILQPVSILSSKDLEESNEKNRPSADKQNKDFQSEIDKVDKNHQEKSSEMNSDIKELKDIASQDGAEGQHDKAVEGEEEEKHKNESSGQDKRPRRQKKNKRMRKHSLQKDEAQAEAEQSQEEAPKSEGNSTDSGAHKTKKRRAGKWGPLVGVNPVQIRATVDLYPSSRAALTGVTHDLEASADPCDNFRCKRGKTCKLDEDKKPNCVCQIPSECPPSVNELDHVCGTDNKTYDTSCELFATKCNLEGTKKGHKLHLDYTGSCKLIPPCLETELVQFPLRMRDWLKNVLLQLYEHDTTTPGFLTSKQRFRVKKIFDSERRLHAGDHPVELLEQDFEKNYNMYIYPVHWQFAQLDQHPSDRQLSHSELAPLRVPLVPMEHCTSLFFQECDADKDKQVSFKEWTSCFGIKEEDMDTSLLF